jgi:hypothetical protein
MASYRPVLRPWSVALEQRASAGEKVGGVRHEGTIDHLLPQAHARTSAARDWHDLLAELARIDRERSRGVSYLCMRQKSCAPTTAWTR